MKVDSEPMSLRLARAGGWVVVGSYLLLGALGVAVLWSPELSSVVEPHLGLLRTLALLLVVAAFGIWGTAVNLVMGDANLTPKARRRWILALVLFNLFAGVFFVLWGYRGSVQRGAQ